MATCGRVCQSEESSGIRGTRCCWRWGKGKRLKTGLIGSLYMEQLGAYISFPTPRRARGFILWRNQFFWLKDKQLLWKLRVRCHIKNRDGVKVGMINGMIPSHFCLLCSKNSSNQVYIPTLAIDYMILLKRNWSVPVKRLTDADFWGLSPDTLQGSPLINNPTMSVDFSFIFLVTHS